MCGDPAGMREAGSRHRAGPAAGRRDRGPLCWVQSSFPDSGQWLWDRRGDREPPAEDTHKQRSHPRGGCGRELIPIEAKRM